MSDTNSIRFETRRPYAGSLWAWGRRFTPDQAEQLREFLQAKRDQELGRWRDPEDPNMVVYRRTREMIAVVDERDGRSISERVDESDTPPLKGLPIFTGPPTATFRLTLN